jgi:hypothetical protein
LEESNDVCPSIRPCSSNNCNTIALMLDYNPHALAYITKEDYLTVLLNLSLTMLREVRLRQLLQHY